MSPVWPKGLSMPRIKSLLIRTDVDVAKKAHNCKGNARHRIRRGDRRLKVRNGRSWSHYCLECACNIVRRDVDALLALRQRFGP